MTNEEMFKNKDVYREKIIKDNIKLVYNVIPMFIRYRSWDREFQDDLIGEGYIGLCRSVDAFDPSRGIKFSTFATACIKHELYTYIRSINDINYYNRNGKKIFEMNLDEKDLTKRQKRSLRMYKRIAGGLVDLNLLREDEDDMLENIGVEEEYSDEDEFSEIITDLSGLDAYIFHNPKKSNKEIATTFNVTQQTVANHRRKILKKIGQKV